MSGDLDMTNLSAPSDSSGILTHSHSKSESANRTPEPSS